MHVCVSVQRFSTRRHVLLDVRETRKYEIRYVRNGSRNGGQVQRNERVNPRGEPAREKLIDSLEREESQKWA